jgi:hypothetical protein
MTKSEKRYSEWEYEEESGDQGSDDASQDYQSDDDSGGDDNSSKQSSSVTDDTEIELDDGSKITLAEAKKGYMRQSDYTRKTQELSAKEKEQISDTSKKILDNPEDFPEEDVKTAEYFAKILTKKYGMMTKEEFQAEQEKQRMISDFDKGMRKAEKEVSRMEGIPPFNKEKCLKIMQDTGIHNPKVAWIHAHDAEYRSYILKQGEGTKGYKTEKTGERQHRGKSDPDVSTSEGHEQYLLDELHKMKEA